MHGILHLLQYEEAIFDIIINKIKFKEFSHDVTKNHEEKLQRLLRRLKKDNALSQLFMKIFIPLVPLAKIDGLPKMH